VFLQPRRSAVNAIRGGAISAPVLDPALKIPIALPRSFAGNHSDIALVAAGQLPASPTPRRKRKTARLRTPRAKRWTKVAADHHTNMTANPHFVPIESRNAPDAACMTV